jgi:hypothetical protein
MPSSPGHQPSVSRRPRWLPVAALVLVAVLGVGCAGQDDAREPLSTDEAAALYLQVVCPANLAFEAVGRTIVDWEGAETPLGAEDTALLERAAVVLGVGAATLSTPPQPWPTAVEAGIDEIAEQVAAAGSAFEAMAAESTRAAAYAQRFTATNDAGGEADRVRERLGLPPDEPGANGCPAGSALVAG